MVAIDRRLRGAQSARHVSNAIQVVVCFEKPPSARPEPRHMLTGIFPNLCNAGAAKRGAPWKVFAIKRATTAPCVDERRNGALLALGERLDEVTEKP